MKKEDLSSFMDDALENADDFVSTLSSDKEMQKRWHRYHIARQVMQNKLPVLLIPEAVSTAIAAAIEDMPIDQSVSVVSVPKEWLFLPNFTIFFTKVSQLGIAAAVALAVIVGVQYGTNKESNSGQVTSFNTMPIGVNLSPVGGLNPVMTSVDDTISDHKMSRKEYENIYLLLQEHELQKRLNATE